MLSHVYVKEMKTNSIISHSSGCVCLQAFAYLIPEELFKMELEEGVERVQITISVLRTFKQLFHTHRQQIPKYYKYSEAIKLWDFPSALVFKRSDRIMERLLMIEVLRFTGVALCCLLPVSSEETVFEKFVFNNLLHHCKLIYFFDLLL